MILKLPAVQYQPVARITPSSFTALKGCHFKFILSRAIIEKSILPVSIHSYKGTVAHSILEHISRGNIYDEETFLKFIDIELAAIDEKILKDGNDIYFPLRKKLQNFGLFKISLRNFLKEKKNQKTPNSPSKFSSEMWCESKDKQVGGKIDLIAEYPSHVEIIDFKTGAITEEMMDDEGEKVEEIKIDYQEQLKLYAALYYEHTGIVPRVLNLVDLKRTKFEVAFTIDECLELLSKAKKLLKIVNNEISCGTFVTCPSVVNCRFCLNRPACQSYQSALVYGLKTNDIRGKIVKTQKFLNGNVSLFLQTQNGNALVKNFDISFYESFNNAIGKTITVYNIKVDKMENSFLATNMTRIYEQ